MIFSYSRRLVREQILIQLERDALPTSVDIPSEISRQELELDKLLITLVQTSCKADKLDRALDYTSRLHHLASFDLAQKVADFYHLPGLKERMRKLKESKERAMGEDVDEDGRIIREGWGRVLEPVPRAGVAELEPAPAHSRRSRYTEDDDDGYDSARRYGAAATTSKYNSKHSLEFPPQPAVPRRSLATAAASSLPSSSSLSSSYPVHAHAPNRRVGHDPRDTSSPPPGDSLTSFAQSDDPFATLDNTQETSATYGAKRKYGAGETGDDADDSNVMASPRKRRPSPPANQQRGAAAASATNSKGMSRHSCFQSPLLFWELIGFIGLLGRQSLCSQEST